MSIGKDPDAVDDETPDDQDVAAALGFDDVDADTSTDSQTEETAGTTIDIPEEVSDANDLLGVVRDLANELGQTKQQLAKERRDRQRLEERHEERLDEAQQDRNRADRNRKEIASRLNEVTDEIDDVDAEAEEAKEIAKTASANAEQAKEIAETGGTVFDREDAEGLPEGVEASSSTLDFLANCRQHRVKKHLVDNGTPRKNRFRALLVMKRWDEFATKRKNGSGIFWTRNDVKTALTAILGEEPHAQTLKRVWKEMVAIGSSDVDVTERRISAKQDAKKIIAMDIETAEGLLEARYHHLELIDADGNVTGVTPVVIDNDAAEV